MCDGIVDGCGMVAFRYPTNSHHRQVARPPVTDHNRAWTNRSSAMRHSGLGAAQTGADLSPLGAEPWKHPPGRPHGMQTNNEERAMEHPDRDKKDDADGGDL